MVQMPEHKMFGEQGWPDSHEGCGGSLPHENRPILLLHQERGPDSRRMQGIGPALEKCAEAEEGGIVPVPVCGFAAAGTGREGYL